MALTTPAKVRARINIETYQASDAIINQFITDGDGMISYRIGSLPTSTDDNYALASSTSTTLAAFYTGIQMPYPEDKDEATAWMDKLKNLRLVAEQNLDILSGVQTPIPVARSTTED